MKGRRTSRRHERLVAAALAATASVLALAGGLVALGTLVAGPAGASGAGWQAFVANVYGGNATYLTGLQSGTAVIGGSVGGMSQYPFGTAISPDGQYAFVSNDGSTQARSAVYVINTTTDTLTQTIKGTGANGLNGPLDMAVSPDGTQLWVADINSNAVSVLCAAPSGCGATAFGGALAKIAGPAFLNAPSDLNQPIDVAVTPNGVYAYVSNFNANTAAIFCADAAGCAGTSEYHEMPSSISPLNVTGSTSVIGVDWTAFTPDGKYAYSADCGNYNCNANGNISLIQNPEALPPSAPSVVQVVTTGALGTNQIDIAPDCTPSSCLAFVTNADAFVYPGANIQVYKNADSGSLPTLATTIAAGASTGLYNPTYFAVTPDSKYLVVTDQGGYDGTGTDQVAMVSIATDTVTQLLTAGSINAPWTVATQPDQAPTASFLAYPAAAGQPSYFDGSASSSPVGTVTSWAWDFGDGCSETTTTATVSFSYPSSTGGSCPSPASGTVTGAGGTYTVTLRVTNSAGTSTAQVFTGHTMSNNGSSSAQATRTVTLPTKLTITASPTAGVQSSTPNIGPITVEMQTPSGTPVDAPEAGGPAVTVSMSASPTGGSFSAWNATSCNSSPTFTSTPIPAGTSSVSVCFGDSTAGTYTLTFSAPGLASATENITVSPPGPYQIAFGSAPVSGLCMGCGGPTTPNLGPITLQVENAAGSPVNAGGSGVTVSLSSSSATGEFSAYSGGACTASPLVTSVVIASTSSSTQVCYGDTTTGTPTITASTTGLSVNSATQTETVAGPASQTVFTTPPESALYITSTTPDMGPITVSLEDSSGRITDASANLTVTMSSTTPGTGPGRAYYFSAWTGSACSATDTTTFTIPSGSSAVEICYGYNTGDTNPVLTATVTGLTAGSQTETVTAGPPYKIAFASSALSGPASAVPNLGPITVQLEDSGGFAASATSTMTVSLSSSSATGTFSVYSSGACSTTDVTSVTIAPGSYSAQICYGDSTAGMPTVTASTTGLTVNSATQQETVTAAAPAVLVFSTSSKTDLASSSPNMGPITVELQDAFGNVATAASPYTVSLTSTSATGLFSAWTGTACSATTLTSVTIGSGSSSTSVCYGDTTAGSPTVTASTTGLTVNSATQSETVDALPPYKMVITTLNLSGPPSTTPNLGPTTALIEDLYGNPTNATSTETISLSSSPAGGAMFSAWTGTACSATTLTSVTIAMGSDSTSVCFGDATTGTYTITLSASPSLSGGSAPTRTMTIAGGNWNQNSYSSTQEQAQAGDFLGVSPLGSSTTMVAVGDNPANVYDGYGYGQVSVAYGATANMDIAHTFDGSYADGFKTSVDSGHTLTSMSCPTASFCGAVDNAGDALSYSSSTWSTSHVDGTNVLSSVSCLSSSLCVAVDSSGNGYYYQGSWLATSATSDTNALNSVSCVSTTVCVAVDASGKYDVFDSQNNSWGGPVATGDTHSLASISCASATLCVAVDSIGDYMTYDSSTGTWSPPAATGDSNPLVSVSCANGTTTCAAVDGSGGIEVYASGSWSGAPATGKTLTAVSCAPDTSASTVYCGAVDSAGDVLFSSAGLGSAWVPTTLDAGNALDSISCPTPTLCHAGDGAGNDLLLVDNGNTIVTGFLASVTCPATAPASTLCVAVGTSTSGAPVILWTTDPTAPGSWTSVTVPPGPLVLDAVTCAPGSSTSTTLCFAVGYGSESGTIDAGASIIESTDGGSSWSDVSSSIADPLGKALGSTVTRLAGAYCVSSSECFAAGEGLNSSLSTTSGVVVVWCTAGDAQCANTGWQIGGYAGGSGAFTGVSCPSTSECFASGTSAGVAVVEDDTSAANNGSSWSQVVTGTGITYLWGIACTSSTNCYAAGWVTSANAGGLFGPTGNQKATKAGGIVISSTNASSAGTWVVSENDGFSESAWYGIDCTSGGLSCTAVGSNFNGGASFYPVAATGS